VKGTLGTVTSVTTGILASDKFGSTYRDVKLSGMGPWVSQGGSEEFIHIKNLSTMMDYIVNLSKNTYEQFPIRLRTPPVNWQGKGPNNGGGPLNWIKPQQENYASPDKSLMCGDAELTSISHTIQIQLAGVTGTTPATITTNRVYCPELKIVVKEDHSDPRFGTRTYVLNNFVPGAPDEKLFSPPFNLTKVPTLVERKNFGHDGGPGGGFKQPPTTP